MRSSPLTIKSSRQKTRSKMARQPAVLNMKPLDIALGPGGPGEPKKNATGMREIGFKRPQKTGIAQWMTRPEAGAVLAATSVFVFFAIFADKFLTAGIMSNVFLLS